MVGKVETLVPVLDASLNPPPSRWSPTSSPALTQLLATRPDVAAILGDLDAIKSLRGGPADATAFHDFHVLQLAFKNVWVHAFDGNLRQSAEQAYSAAVQLYADAGLTVPDTGSVDDVQQLDEFLNAIRGAAGDVAPPVPDMCSDGFRSISCRCGRS